MEEGSDVAIGGLKNDVEFRNFRSFADGNKFSRVNIIYGPNGSGKTTFSDLVAIEGPVGGFASKFLINTNHSIHVFNRTYIDTELRSFTLGDSPVPSIAIGEDDVKKQEERDLLERMIATTKQWQTRVHRARSESPNDRAIGSKAKSEVLKHLDGFKKYNSTQYQNDSNLRSKIKPEEKPLEPAELSELTALVFQTQPALIRTVPESPVSSVGPLVGVSDLLREVPEVSGKEIVGIANDFRSWLLRGFQICFNGDAPDGSGEVHQETYNCPFCEGVVNDDRIHALRETFQSRVTQLVSRCESKVEDLQGCSERIKEFESQILRLRSDLTDADKDIRDEIQELVESVTDRSAMISSAIRYLEEKISTPLQVVGEDAAHNWNQPFSINTENLEFLVQERNSQLRQHEASQIKAAARVEASILAGFHADLVSSRERHQKITRAENSLARRLERDVRELEELLATISNKRRPAAAMNELLHKSLGITSFSVTVSEDDLSYAVKRDNGQSATHLSDGERQALSLSYFLQTLKSEEVDSKGAVVFFDDPVLGVDEGRTNVILQYLCSISKDWAQVFISTHNFAVFKKAYRLWTRSVEKPGEEKPETIYPSAFEAYRDSDGFSRIRRMPDRYVQFSGEYQFLFNQVIEAGFSEPTKAPPLDIRNSARRLLEAFLEFHNPISNASLRQLIEASWGQVDNSEPLAPLMRGVLSSLNEGSHAPSVSPALDNWRTIDADEIRTVYAFMTILNPQHVLNMVNSLYPKSDPHKRPLRQRVDKYGKKVAGLKSRAAGGDDFNCINELKTVFRDGVRRK